MKIFVPFCESLLGSALEQDVPGELVPYSHTYACLRAMRPEILDADGQAHPVTVPRDPGALERLLQRGSGTNALVPMGLTLAEA